VTEYHWENPFVLAGGPGQELPGGNNDQTPIVAWVEAGWSRPSSFFCLQPSRCDLSYRRHRAV